MESGTEPKRRVTIMQLLRPHRKALSVGLLAIAGESVADLLTPWPLKIVLDNVLGQTHKKSHGWLDAVIQRTAGTGVMHILEFACVAVLAIAVLDAICTYGDKYVTTSVGQWVTHDLRSRLYAQVQRLSLTYHDQNQTGDLISRVTTDIDAVQTFIVSGMLTMLVDIVTVFGMIGIMFYLSWRLTLIALVVVPPLFAIVYTYTRKVKKASRDVRKHESKLLSVVQEVLGSIRVVKAFAREEYEIQRLEGESLETVEASLKARALKARLVPIVTVVTGIGTCAVLYFGGRSAIEYGLTGGSIYLFITYIRSMYKPMQDISKAMDSYSKADVGYERIQEVLCNENEMCDAPGARDLPPIKGQISIEHVDFWYTQDQPVLKDVNIEVEPGKTIALVGPTGSGKTTIVNLIARFYDPVHGVVKIDGYDVKQVTQESLRRQIGFVLQDTVLFTGTIWENIAYGRPGASHSDIVKAAEAANAMDFIDKLPDKFGAVVGERGLTLSGGQRQRIAIARAIVRNSPILILDEPSSGLDAASEELVFEALDRLMQGKTSIVIAHRLSTIRSASCIYVVQEGGIVESGTHDELLQREGGEYKALYDIQFNSSPEDANATLA
ncbi:MAG TPA: ABC transporter ATP-binding protein [Acidobacteriaceae bacterium]|nr:ABC transporter ATP-binding protein [Acidobacteriaceae bacterium]